MGRSYTKINAIAHIDERLGSLHEYVHNDLKPMLEKLMPLLETTRWLKLAVVGIYSGIGLMICQFVFQQLVR